jgi:endoglucanase
MPNPLVPLALLLTMVAGLLHPASSPSPGEGSGPAPRTSQSARAADTDPFRRHPWANYQGPQDMVFQPYQQATGARKQTLRYLALQPKAKWFGAWIPDSQIAAKVHDYIANAQAGNPDALVQMTVFRMVPWENEACRRLPTTAEQASYKRWIDRFAAAVGTTPAAIVLQPDGPFALCAPHGSTLPSRLVAYAARVLSAQPRTSVYVEAGAADWPHAGSQGGVEAAVKILVRGGIRYARGFALNSTHFDATADEIARAAAVSQALAAAGYPGRKAVINTSTNGHPFEYGWYTGKDANNPTVCPSTTTPAATTCVTIGIPPTADVANPRWKLPATSARLAQTYVDAYLWIGRPWLYRQATPFVLRRALDLVRSTPWR